MIYNTDLISMKNQQEYENSWNQLYKQILATWVDWGLCWKDLLDCNVDIYVSAFRIGVLQAVTATTTPSSCTHSSRTTQSSSRESFNAVATVASGESYQGKQNRLQN